MPLYANKEEFTALSLALTAIWRREMVINSEVRRFYNESPSTRAAERTQNRGNFGLVPEQTGSSFDYDDVDVGDRKEFIHRRKSKGLKIPQDFVEDDSYAQVEAMLMDFAESFTTTVAYDMASTFNEAFSTSKITAADSRALCSTGRNSGKAVLNNKGTSALTHDNVVATRKLMRQFKDTNGLVINALGDSLIVPVGLMDKGEEIVSSVLRSDNAENATNVNRPLTLVVEPLLEDDNDWFLVDSRRARRHLWWWWRIRPENNFEVDPRSRFDLELRTRGTMRYSFGPDDFTWIYGHEVANS